MLFTRKSVGLEISPTGLVFVLLQGSKSKPRLERLGTCPLPPDILRPSLREVNILDPQAFTECLREAHTLLMHRGVRLSVSLPDAIGRVMLLNIEERFKNRAEGLDIIRWKLKKSLPFDVDETHLDYQQLMTREDGSLTLLVTLASRSVVSQYEDLISAAGFHASQIDLNSFNLCRVFESELSLLENGAFITSYGDTLGIMIFMDGIPVFIRFKYLPQVADNYNRVFTEVSSSLLVFREKFPEINIQTVLFTAPPEVSSGFSNMLEEAIGLKPVMLETKNAVKSFGDAPADQDSLFPCTAAIGAAMRNL